MGNLISSLMKDMKDFRPDGILEMSEKFASGMKVSNNDLVSFTTKYANVSLPVKIIPELDDNTVLLRPGWDNYQALTDGINLNNSYIFAKIEKK